MSVSTVFTNALLDKKENSKVTDKTLKEYKRNWDKHLANNPLAQKDIRHVTAKEWRQFFIDEVKKHSLPHKRFSELRTVVNLMMSYCINNDLLSYNVIRDMDCRDFPFADDDTSKVKAKSFTKAHIKLILQWCKNQLTRTNIRPL